MDSWPFTASSEHIRFLFLVSFSLIVFVFLVPCSKLSCTFVDLQYHIVLSMNYEHKKTSSAANETAGTRYTRWLVSGLADGRLTRRCRHSFCLFLVALQRRRLQVGEVCRYLLCSETFLSTQLHSHEHSNVKDAVL